MGAGSSAGKQSTDVGTSKADVIKTFGFSEEEYDETLRDLEADGTLGDNWTEPSVDPEAAAGNRVVPNPKFLFDGLDVDPRIGTATADEAIETIALGYCGTESIPADDLLNWVLGPRWVAFDSLERKDMCRYYGKYGVASCSMKGIVGLRDPATSEGMAVMLLRRSAESDFDVMRTALKAGSPPHTKKKVYGKEPLRREAAIVKAMKQLAHKGPQYILYNLAVKPAHQGKGCATALVRALVALGGREGVPVYLDASERLQTFYSRLGFEKQTEVEVVDPTGQEGSGSLVLASMKSA